MRRISAESAPLFSRRISIRCWSSFLLPIPNVNTACLNGSQLDRGLAQCSFGKCASRLALRMGKCGGKLVRYQPFELQSLPALDGCRHSGCSVNVTTVHPVSA